MITFHACTAIGVAIAAVCVFPFWIGFCNENYPKGVNPNLWGIATWLAGAMLVTLTSQLFFGWHIGLVAGASFVIVPLLLACVLLRLLVWALPSP